MDIATRMRSAERSGVRLPVLAGGGEALARALGREGPDEAARDDEEDGAVEHRLAEEPELEADEGRGQDGRRVVDREAEEHAPLVLASSRARGPPRSRPATWRRC